MHVFVYIHKYIQTQTSFADVVSMIASLIILYWKTSYNPSAHFFTMIPETWTKGV